ncbi:MAG: hypothetical protein Q7V40_08390 [Pseudolabrys sp.]|nr:hypothetical protein [Pseudolabrys sp.]
MAGSAEHAADDIDDPKLRAFDDRRGQGTVAIAAGPDREFLVQSGWIV